MMMFFQMILCSRLLLLERIAAILVKQRNNLLATVRLQAPFNRLKLNK